MRDECDSLFQVEPSTKPRKQCFVRNASDLCNLTERELLPVPVVFVRPFGLSWKRTGRGNKVSTRHPSLHSDFYKRERNPVFVSPRIDVLRDSIDCQKVLVSSVSVLSERISPSTIVFAIAFVVVNTIKAGLRIRTGAHVLVKVLKDFPAFANGNASASVVFVGVVRGVVASLSHAMPNLVFGRFGEAVVCLADCCGAGIARLKNAFLLGVTKLGSFTDGFLSTRATAKPPLLVGLSIFFRGFRFANDSPQAKLLASQVDRFAHLSSPVR